MNMSNEVNIINEAKCDDDGSRLTIEGAGFFDVWWLFALEGESFVFLGVAWGVNFVTQLGGK